MPEQVGVSLDFVKGNEKALDDALLKVKELQKAGTGIELNFKIDNNQNSQLEALNKNMTAFNKIMKDIKLDSDAVERVNKISEVMSKAIGNFNKMSEGGNATTVVKGYSDLINVFKKLNAQDFDASKLLHNTKSLQQALDILKGTDVNINIASSTKGLAGLITSMNKLSKVNLDGELIAKNLRSLFGALNSLNGVSINPQILKQLRDLSEINLNGIIGGGAGGGASTARTGLIYSAMNTAIMYSRMLFKNFDEFEHTLLNIAVAGEISLDRLSNVRNEIYEMSRTAGVSANEIAKSMDEVIKTGYDLKDSIFIVDEAVKLSVSTGDSLQASALALSKTMLTFGLEAKNATDIINMMQSVANKTPASMNSIQEALKQSNSVFANYVNYTTKTGKVLEDYQKSLLQTQLSLVGGLSVAGRKGEQIGTSLRALATKLPAMEKTGKELFDTQMRMTNGYIILDKATNEYRITNEKTAESFLLTSDYLKALSEEDLTKTINLMSQLVINGNLSATSLNKIFTIQHGGYLANAFYQINGNLDKFNEKMSTGTTAQENFDKVQNSFIKSWDRFKQSLLGVNGVFADFLNTAGKPIIDILGGITSGISALNNSSMMSKVIIQDLTAVLLAGGIGFRLLGKEGQTFTKFLTTSLIPVTATSSQFIIGLNKQLGRFAIFANPLAILGAFAVVEGIMSAYNAWVQSTEESIAKTIEQMDRMKEASKELIAIKEQYNIMMKQRISLIDKDSIDDIKKLDRYMLEAISSFSGLDSANTAITTLNTSLIGLNSTIRELSKTKATRIELAPEISLDKRLQNRISELDSQKSESGLGWDELEKEKKPYVDALKDSAKNILAKRDEAEAFRTINKYIYLEIDGLKGVNNQLEAIGYSHEYVLNLYQRADEMRRGNLKNENAIIEAMQKRNELVKAQYDTIVEGISSYNFQLQKTAMADIKFPTMEGVKEKLTEFGFGEYAKEVGNYNATFDKMYTNSDKVDLLKNKFMSFISTQEGLKSMRKNLEENNKLINETFGESIKRYEKMTGATRNNIDAKLKETSVGSQTHKMLQEQKMAYEELDMANLKNKKSIDSINNAEKQNKANLNTINTQYEQLELLNGTYDEQLKMLSKINATKLEAINIDREAYDIQYKNRKSQLDYNINIQKGTVKEEGLSNESGYLTYKKNRTSNLDEAIKSYEINGKLNESQVKAHNILLKLSKDISEAKLLELERTQKLLDLNKQEYDIKNETVKNYINTVFGDEYSLKLQEANVDELKKELTTKSDIYDKMNLIVEINKAELEISNKKLEKEKKILELKRDITKYSKTPENTSGMGDIAKIKSEYAEKGQGIIAERKKFYEDMLDIKSQQPSGKEDVSKAIENLTKEKSTLEAKANISSITEAEKTQNANRVKDLTTQINLLDKYNQGEITSEELLENNIKYLEAKRGFVKADYDLTNNRIIQTEKEQKAMEDLAEINQKILDNKAQLESYKSVDILSTVLGENKAKEFDSTSYDKIIKNSQSNIDKWEKAHKITTDEQREKAKQDYADYAKLVADGQSKEMEKEKALIEYKKEKYRTELEGISKGLSMIETISKGGTPKIDTASAMEGTSKAILKAKGGKALNSSDYMNMGVTTVGLITNAFDTGFQAQMKAIDYELSTLDLRKQLAQSEEERQKIDLEILEKKKQQIDIQFKQSTQTAGITGVAGSALGGALSGATTGAMLGMKSGNPLFAVVGGAVGGLGGIIGGSSAKKQAEQQKRQLEAQLRANQYLEKLQGLMEANNKLVESVYGTTAKGFNQAMQEAFKEFKQSQKEKEFFNLPKDKIGQFNKISTGNSISKALGLGKVTSSNKDDIEKQAVALVDSTMKELQSGIMGLTYNSTETEFSQISGEIATFKAKIEQFYKDTSSNADDLLIAQLEDWESYIKSLELLSSKKDVFYSAYFGFDVDYIKDEAGFITDVMMGEWEKRTSLLDVFVESSLGSADKISKAVATLTIEGFANAFIRNNEEISGSLKKLETGILDFSTFMATGTSKDFEGIRKGLAGVMSGEELNDVYKITEVKSLVQTTKELTGEQEKCNLAVQEFASLWVKAGGSIEDIIDMMPEFSKSFQTAMQSTISDTSYIDRFNNIGKSLSDSIEKQMEKNLFDKYYTESFMQTNALLTDIMNGAEVKLQDVMNLRSEVEVASAKMETESIKVKSILDTLKMSDVEYTAQNTQVQYTTGSTSTNNYYVTNNVALNVGSMITMSKQDKDALAYELADSFIGAIDSKYGKNIIE